VAVSQRLCLPRISGAVARRVDATQPKRPNSPTALRPTLIRNRIVEDDDSSQQVSAVVDYRQLIVGAFRPAQNNYWLLSITPLAADAAGVPFRADHIPLWSRQQARQWAALCSSFILLCSSIRRLRSRLLGRPDQPVPGAPAMTSQHTPSENGDR
jgi:hypothetical protein